MLPLLLALALAPDAHARSDRVDRAATVRLLEQLDAPALSSLDRAELLLAAGFPSAAGYLARTALMEEGDAESHRRAVVALLRLAEVTGDDADLRKGVVRGGMAEDAPEFSDALRLVQAELAFEAGGVGGFEAAHAHLATIPADSPVAVKARYLDGVVLAGLHRPQEALDAFVATVRAVDAHHRTRVTRARAAELDHARELALLGIARVYYAVGDAPAALAWYGRIDARSPLWRVAQLESAWAEYVWADDEEAAASRLVAAGMVGEAAEHPDPGAGVLLAILYRPSIVRYGPEDDSPLRDFNLSDRATLMVEAALRPEVSALRTFIRSNPERPDVLFRQVRAGTAALSAVARARLAADVRFRGFLRHFARIDAERERISAAAPADGEPAAPWLAVLDKEAKVIEERAGRRMVEVLTVTSAELQGLVTQAELIRLEGWGCR